MEQIAYSNHPNFLLDAPPGVGNSLIGIGNFRKMFAGRPPDAGKCVYVTKTIQLQQQILSEFPDARTMMGRRNFDCLKRPGDFTAEHCTGRAGCKFKHECPYVRAKLEAIAAPIAVLNEAYFLREINGPAAFANADLVVLDEVDALESSLMSMIEFKLTTRQLNMMELIPPENHQVPGAWVEWVKENHRLLDEYCVQLRMFLEDQDAFRILSSLQVEQMKDLVRKENFATELNQFSYRYNDTWLFMAEQSGENWTWTFKPTFVSRYAEYYLWKYCRKVLGMSGTIFDPQIMANEIGLKDFEYEQIDSPFPVENRPIYFLPAVKLSYKSMDNELPNLVAAVEDIISRYPGQKVLIHTVSYKVTDYLMQNIQDKSRLLTHTQDKATRDWALATFKESDEPRVMISPSFERGVDLKGEYCRCVIICKVPYMSKSDEQVKVRLAMAGGNRWYNLRAAQALVQMSGRGVRGPTDYCDTWILDKGFRKFNFSMRNVIPQWWRGAVQEIK